jgi:hypothetical protein
MEGAATGDSKNPRNRERHSSRLVEFRFMGPIFAPIAITATLGATLGCALSTEGMAGAGATAGTTGAEGGSGADGSGGAAQGGTGASVGGAAGAATCRDGRACVPSDAGAAYVFVVAAAPCPEGSSDPAPHVEDGTDPGCTACACNDPQGGSCDAAEFTIHEMCNSGQADSYTFDDGTCVDVVSSATDQITAVAQNDPYATPGSCQSSASTPVALSSSIVCKALPGEACGDGGTCVPPLVGAGQVCLVVVGGSACPAGLVARRPLFPITGDDRSCACGCGTPPDGTCAGAGLTVFSGENCSGANDDFVAANAACVNPGSVGTIESMLIEAGTWAPGGQCPPVDMHTGAVTFGAAVELCCAP